MNHSSFQARRSFFSESWKWLRLLLIAVFAYPVIKFVGYKTPRKKERIRVYKELAPGRFSVERDFIIFEGDSGPWAVSRKCTHLGCRVNISEEEGILLCPCHQSRYSFAGKLLKGPAQRDLPTYTVEKMTGSEKGYVVIF
jgi:Rieske Fe-S protein